MTEATRVFIEILSHLSPTANRDFFQCPELKVKPNLSVMFVTELIFW